MGCCERPKRIDESENPDGQAAQRVEGGGAGYDTKALCELQWVMVRFSGTSFPGIIMLSQ